MIATALRQILFWTVVCGLIYPLLLTAFGQLLFPRQANASMLSQSQGSLLVGQDFSRPGVFWPRPSATAEYPYNAATSSGSNLGPNQPRNPYPRFGPDAPPELRTASGSGLDPHLTPEAALFQVARVARERGVNPEQLRKLVAQFTEKPTLGVLGNSRVNVLKLNLALPTLVPTHAVSTTP